MRISHHHHTTLAYCRELQVATEVFVPDCESAYLAETRGPLQGAGFAFVRPAPISTATSPSC